MAGLPVTKVPDYRINPHHERPAFKQAKTQQLKLPAYRKDPNSCIFPITNQDKEGQ